jgi:methylamine dehydrogenase accessory protein MauD
MSVDLLLLSARLLLAAVFTVAGVAKLADRKGSRQAVEDFGVPARLSGVVATVLPVVELGVAIALILTSFAWWGALGALALLATFVAAIVVNLARGRHPNCQCFGQLHTAPVGRSTLIRNLVLAAIAGFVVWQGQLDVGASATAWLFGLSVLEAAGLVLLVLVVVVLVLEGWLGFNLLRQHGRLLLRVEELEKRLHPEAPSLGAEQQQAAPVLGLPVGNVAPEFRLPDLEGETRTLADLTATGKPVLLLFSDPSCGPCTALLPQIGSWQDRYADRLSVVLVSVGAREENVKKAAAHGIDQVLMQERREVAEAYRYAGTPSAVLISSSGRIASPLAAGADAITTLVRQSVGGRELLPLLPSQSGHMHQGNGHVGKRLSVGDPAPSIALSDLNGQTVDLARLDGRESVLLFWNPSCGFCQQMLPDLLTWEEQRPPDTAGLIIVSTGSQEKNKELGLRSPILVDPHGKTMAAFGANGTPMAVLLDVDGNVASELAVGKRAVLDLANTTGSYFAVKPASLSEQGQH